MAPETFPAAESPELETPEETTSLLPDYGDHNENLPKQIIDIFKAAIEEFQGHEKFARRREVRRDYRLRLYSDGIQYLLWTGAQGSPNAGFMQLTPGTMVSGPGGSIQCPSYMDAYNIFFAYLRIVWSVLTQSLPGVNPQPEDASLPDDIDAAKAASEYEKLFDRMNDIKDLMGQVARMMGLSGRTVEWTRTEEDAQRFGTDAAGAPVRFQRVTIHGTMESRVPILAREFDRNCLHAFIIDDLDVKVVQSRYPWAKDKIKPEAAIGENNYERYARLGILANANGQFQIGDSLGHIVSGYPAAFFRPETFMGKGYEDPFEDDPSMTVEEFIQQRFPDGVRVVFYGQTYCGAYAECVDEHIAVEFPYEGDGLSRAGFMELISIVQDNFNDLANWIREKVDTGAGFTLINANRIEVDALTSQRAAPNAIMGVKDIVDLPAGQPLSDAVYETNEVQVPDTLYKLLEFMRGTLPQFLLAALPSLQGGEVSDNNTASGYAQATANAKGQLTIIWGRMQRLFARIREQAAWAAQADETRTGKVTVPGKSSEEKISVDYDALRKGNFGYYMDEDSGFPESTAQKRNTLQNMMNAAGQSPEMAQLLDNPANIQQYLQDTGWTGLVFVPAEARTKQLFEIKQLLETAPLPPDPQMVEESQVAHATAALQSMGSGGQAPPFAPPPSQPSVPIQDLDFHQYEFATCQEWLSSKARREEDKRGNTAGIQNVILHAKAHQAAMAQMAMAAASAAPQPGAPGPGQASPPREVKPTPGTVAPQTT